MAWSEAVKYDMCRSAHAEANAIALAAKKGVSIEDASIYCTLEPCITCAKLIIMSGIIRWFYEHAYDSPHAGARQILESVLASSNVVTEQIIIDEAKVRYAFGFLEADTSKRRI
jgi:dCMP deaminase